MSIGKQISSILKGENKLFLNVIFFQRGLSSFRIKYGIYLYKLTLETTLSNDTCPKYTLETQTN